MRTINKTSFLQEMVNESEVEPDSNDYSIEAIEKRFRKRQHERQARRLAAESVPVESETKDEDPDRVEPPESERWETARLMEKARAVPRCNICGGWDYVYSPVWPGERYCRHCGIHLNPFRFEQMQKIFKAQSSLRLLASTFENKDHPIYDVHSGLKIDIVAAINQLLDSLASFWGKPNLAGNGQGGQPDPYIYNRTEDHG